MANALFLVSLDGGDRPLSRLLFAADGRAAVVHGVVSLPGPLALMWVGVPETRIDHVVAAIGRLIGVRHVCVVEQVAPPVDVARHRVHMTDEVVDVSVAFDLMGVRYSGGGDGPTLLSATSRAVTGCLSQSDRSVSGWLALHPVSGVAVAVVRDGRRTVCATGRTPQLATLSAVVGLVAADHRAVEDHSGGVVHSAYPPDGCALAS